MAGWPKFLVPLAALVLAALSYVAAVWIHQWESHLLNSSVPHPTWGATLRRVALEHRLTLVPWLLGVTSLAALLGHLVVRGRGLEARLERLAVTDGLTALYNQRFFKRALLREIARMHRSRSGFSLLLIDLEDLERFSAAHGHHARDEALQRCARTLSGALRETDLIARYDGEEFAVLAVGADESGAVVVADKLRTQLADTVPLSVNIGVATFGKDGRSANDLLDAADVAIRRAKHDRRNRVFAA